MPEQIQTSLNLTPCPRCGKALKPGNVEIASAPPCHRPFRTQYLKCTNRKCAIINVSVMASTAYGWDAIHG
jgi:hypothetical protein